MKRKNFVLIYFVINILGITIEIYRKWDVYSTTVVIFALLFSILFLLSAIGYLSENKRLMYMAIICLLLKTLYMVIAFIWIMFQDTAMILPLIAYLIIALPINLYIIFHLKDRVTV